MTIQRQRELLNLKPGDKVYFIVEGTEWGKPDLITITGECEEGLGYEAHSPRFTADSHDGTIHTCNGFIAKTKREARAECLRYLKKRRKEYAEEQAHANRVIQYLDYVISRGGRY